MHPSTLKAIDILFGDDIVHRALISFIDRHPDLPFVDSTLLFVENDLVYFTNEELTKEDIENAQWSEVLMHSDLWDE